MKTVVEIYNDEPRAGTWILSSGFKRRHAEVLRLCRNYESEFMELEERKVVSNHFIRRKIKGEKGGAPIKEYMLNKAQTIFLGSMFRAKKGNDPVLRFKIQLAKDFVKQEKIIAALLSQRQSPEWIESRALGKIERKNETDAIKDFQEYCRKQGSLNPEKYYINFSNVVNDGLFDFNGTFLNKRESMTANQLRDVKFGDSIVARGVIEGMALEMPYKDIYEMVKNRLISLGEMCGRSEIISRQLMLFD
jgi:hypothetical protein